MTGLNDLNDLDPNVKREARTIFFGIVLGIAVILVFSFLGWVAGWL